MATSIQGTPAVSQKETVAAKKDVIGTKLAAMGARVSSHSAFLMEAIAECEANKKQIANKIRLVDPELLRQVDETLPLEKRKLCPYISMLHLICIKVRSFFYKYFGSFQLDRTCYLHTKQKQDFLKEQILKNREHDEAIIAIRDAKISDEASVKASAGAYAARLEGLHAESELRLYEIIELRRQLAEGNRLLQVMSTDLSTALDAFGASRLITGYESLKAHCKAAQGLLVARSDLSTTTALRPQLSSASFGSIASSAGLTAAAGALPRSSAGTWAHDAHIDEHVAAGSRGAPKIADLDEAEALEVVGLVHPSDALVVGAEKSAAGGGSLDLVDGLAEEAVLVPAISRPCETNINIEFLNDVILKEIGMRPLFGPDSALFVFKDFFPKMKSFTKLGSGVIQLEFEKETSIVLKGETLTEGVIKQLITIKLPKIVELTLDSIEPKINFVKEKGMSALPVNYGWVSVTPQMNGIAFKNGALEFDLSILGLSQKQSLSLSILEEVVRANGDKGFA